MPIGMHDFPEERPLPRSVDPARLEQIVRDARVEVAHQEDAERQAERNVKDDRADQGPEQVQPGGVVNNFVQAGYGYQRHLQRQHKHRNDEQKDQGSSRAIGRKRVSTR